MVDIVVNHFAWAGANDTINYSRFAPFGDQKYFHPYCLIESFADTANDSVIQNVGYFSL
jgi:alpha-amylase